MRCAAWSPAWGTSVEEMAHNRERSICCGSGGMVPAVAPELAKKMTDFRLSEATRDLVTYCASCRARLAKAGHPTLHVLDLPFNPAWQQTKTQPPPHSLIRWWRRWRLKRYFGKLVSCFGESRAPHRAPALAHP